MSEISGERIERAAKAMIDALNEREPTSEEWWRLDNEERDLALHIARAALTADATEIAAAEARGVANGLEMARPELKRLYRGYVNTLESAHDIFMAMGRDCDPVDRMEHDDPALRSARYFIAFIDARLSAMERGE